MNLITAAEVIAIAFNDKNFLPGKILDSHIEIAQEGFIRPSIGDDFYLALTAGTPSGDNAIFVNSYLKKPLAWYVRYVMLPEIMVHASNTGMQLVQAQGSQSASDKQSGLLREQAKANGEILLRVSLQYLAANTEKYPLYDYDGTTSIRSRVIGGIVFSKMRKRSIPDPSVVTTVSTGGIMKTISDIRGLTVHNTGDVVICASNNYIYEYDADSTTEDDSDLVLKPDNTVTGRWIMIKEMQTVNL